MTDLNTPQNKIKINVGCGERPIPGFVNTDAIAHPEANKVCPAWDLGFEDGSAIELQCHHVIEHFFPKDWPPTLDEFWRVLAPGGEILISCPDFGEVARGYVEGRYSIEDARTLVTATVPPFNSCDYNVPESYHRTVHSEDSLKADLTAKGFVDVKSWHEGYAWNVFVRGRKPFEKISVRPGMFAVVLPCIPNYIHTGALQEAAEGVHFALQGLGYDSVLTDSLDLWDRQNIVFGPQVLLHLAKKPVEGSIVFNLEQCDAPIAELILPLLKEYEVWDYSERNVNFWSKHGIWAQHVPLGYVPELSRIKPMEPKDIDVLFYGCLNSRRRKVLDDLRLAGLSVVVLDSVYGFQRDTFIARSKVVLNMHYYEPGIFEIARCSYLLANEVCVVSEIGIGDEAFKEAVSSVPYDQLVSVCVEMVNSEEKRRAHAKRGFEIMKTFDQKTGIKTALSKSVAQLWNGAP
jgi:hypothetical protein